MSAPAVDALAELVALEELRQRCEALPYGVELLQLREEHDKRRPMAWARAHAALAQARTRLTPAAVQELDSLRAIQRARGQR